MIFQTTGLPQIDTPPLGFRFGVVFLMNGKIPNPIDLRFQSVSGIGARLVTEDLEKSASASESLSLGQRVQYENLRLERGVLLASPLSIMLEQSFKEMKFLPTDVMVSVLNETFIPIKTWLFSKAFPVSWSISGISATNNDVLIEQIELNYARFTTLSL